LHIAHDRIHIVFSSNIVLNTARPFHCAPAIANSYQNPASAKQNAQTRIRVVGCMLISPPQVLLNLLNWKTSPVESRFEWHRSARGRLQRSRSERCVPLAHKLLRTGSAVRCECQGDISRQMAVGTLCYPSPSPSVRTSSPNQVVRRFAGRQLSFSVAALVMVRNASWSGRVVAFHYCSDQGFRSSRHSCNTGFPYRKVWMGKNWARLTLLAWFLLGCIESLVQHLSAYPGSRPGEH